LQQIQADRREGLAQVAMTDLVIAAMEAASPGDFSNLRHVYHTLANRGRHFVDRFSRRVESVKEIEPLTYKYDFFLAHSSKDVEITDAIRQGLEARKVRVFVDNRTLRPGQVWTDELLAAQKASKVTIALVSTSSVKSPWFKSECTTALELRTSGLAHALVPVLLDETEMPYGTNIVQGIKVGANTPPSAIVDGVMQALEDVNRSLERLATE
jgi:hypothetical protein